MKLSLKNIGIIQTSEIELNGITVLTGMNGSGKRTMSKSLFASLSGLYKLNHTIHQLRLKDIASTIQTLLNRLIEQSHLTCNAFTMSQQIIETSSFILSKRTEWLTNENDLNDYLHLVIHSILHESIDKSLLKQEIDTATSKIIKVLAVSDSKLKRTVIQKHFHSEFDSQIQNIYSNENSELCLKIKDQEIKFIFKNNELVELTNPLSLGLNTVYFDHPFVLDYANQDVPFDLYYLNSSFLNESSQLNHNDQLKNLIKNASTNTQSLDTAIYEILTKEKLDKIISKINTVCSGNLKNDNGKIVYALPNSNKQLSVYNMSSGLKTFAILKTLLLNGSIKENSTLILDEVETHLHPQYQVLLAEIIVLLEKEFKLHILVNTHSPYFIDAIETYSIKYNVSDTCKYYFTTIENHYSIVNDVTDDTSVIYKSLLQPFQQLEDIRYDDSF